MILKDKTATNILLSVVLDNEDILICIFFSRISTGIDFETFRKSIIWGRDIQNLSYIASFVLSETLIAVSDEAFNSGTHFVITRSI